MAHGAAGDRRRIGKAERQRQTLDLRMRGLSLRQIARVTHVSHQTAHCDIQDALDALAREQRATTEQLRALQVGRVESVLVPVMSKALNGDLDAARVAGSLIEQISRLYGLYGVEPSATPAIAINVQPVLAVLLQVLDGHPDLRIKAAAAFAELETTASEVDP